MVFKLPPLPTWAWLGVGLTIGIIVGYIVRWLMTLPMMRLLNRLKGDVIAIVRDVDNDTIDIVGMMPMGENTYVSTDPMTPITLFKTSDVVPMIFAPLRKPVLFGFTKGFFGFAVNPDSLIKVGLGSMVLKSKYWEVSETPFEASRELLAEMAEKIVKLEDEYKGEITVNPDLKIGLAVRIPDVAKAYFSMMVGMSAASIESTRDDLELTDKYGRRVLEFYRVQVVRKGLLYRVVVYTLMLLMVFGLLYLLFIAK